MKNIRGPTGPVVEYTDHPTNPLSDGYYTPMAYAGFLFTSLCQGYVFLKAHHHKNAVLMTQIYNTNDPTILWSLVRHMPTDDLWCNNHTKIVKNLSWVKFLSCKEYSKVLDESTNCPFHGNSDQYKFEGDLTVLDEAHLHISQQIEVMKDKAIFGPPIIEANGSVPHIDLQQIPFINNN